MKSYIIESKNFGEISQTELVEHSFLEKIFKAIKDLNRRNALLTKNIIMTKFAIIHKMMNQKTFRFKRNHHF